MNLRELAAKFRAEARQGAPGCKLYVGNLPASITKHAMKEAFGRFGEVTDTHVLSGKNQHGALAGFVTFSDARAANEAMLQMNRNYEFEPGMGSITVKEANQK